MAVRAVNRCFSPVVAKIGKAIEVIFNPVSEDNFFCLYRLSIFKKTSEECSFFFYVDQLSSLKSGDVDVLITISRLNDPGLVCREVQSQELGLWVNRHHPFSKKKKIKLADLNNEPFIFHPKSENLGFQKVFQEFLRGNRVIIRPYYKKNNEGCANLVVIGKGHLLTSKRMVESRHDAVFVPLEDFSAKMKIYAYWNTKNNSALVKTFMHFIQDAGHIPASGLDSHFCSLPLR